MASAMGTARYASTGFDLGKYTGGNTGITGGMFPSGGLTQYGNTGIRQDNGLPYTMQNGVPNTNMDSPGTFYNPKQNAPAPAPQPASLTALQQVASAAPAASAAPSAGASVSAGAKVPVPPPVTSGGGDGGAASLDSGIDRIIGAAGGSGMAGVNGLLRASLGQRSRPTDSYVLAGRKAY